MTSPAITTITTNTAAWRRLPWGRIFLVLWMVMSAKNQAMSGAGLAPAVVWATIAVEVAVVVALGATVAVWVDAKGEPESGKSKVAKRLVVGLYVLGVSVVSLFTLSYIFDPLPTKEDTDQLLEELNALVLEVRSLDMRAAEQEFCRELLDEITSKEAALVETLPAPVAPRQVVNDLLRDQVRLYEGGIQDLQDCMGDAPGGSEG